MNWELGGILSILGGMAFAYLVGKSLWQWMHMGSEEKLAGRDDSSHSSTLETMQGFCQTARHWSSPRYLEAIADPFLDELLYLHVQKAVKNRQRMWIRYKGIHCQESERIIEIYRANVDESVFAWCCLRQEPRIFQRDRVLAWCLLNERFYQEPLLASWAEEEYPYGEDAIPWNRWRQMKGALADQDVVRLIPYQDNREILN